MLISSNNRSNQIEMIASTDEECLVLEEIWQNERWQPNGGFCVPFTMTEAVAHFTDRSGEVPYSRNAAFPDISLPSGWRWESNDWDIDLSGSYGGCDANGWMYASGFNSLFHMIETNTATGELSKTCLVRRRRWIRMRECVSGDAIEIFKQKLNTLKIHKGRLEHILRHYHLDISRMDSYESSRLLVFKQIYSLGDGKIQKNIGVFETTLDKLNKLEMFLMERGSLERDYSRRLEAFATKWIGTGGVIGESNSESRNGGTSFFQLTNTATVAIAQRLQSFSLLVSDSLVTDVREVIVKAKIGLKELRQSSAAFREAIKIAENGVNQAKNAMRAASTSMQTDATNIVTVISKAFSAFYTHRTEPKDIHYYISNAAKLCGISNTTPTSRNIDFWAAITKYRSALTGADKALRDWSDYALKNDRETAFLATQVSSLLHATVKIFANEQAQVWEDASFMLMGHLGWDTGRRGGSGAINSKASISQQNINEAEVSPRDTVPDSSVDEPPAELTSPPSPKALSIQSPNAAKEVEVKPCEWQSLWDSIPSLSLSCDWIFSGHVLVGEEAQVNRWLKTTNPDICDSSVKAWELLSLGLDDTSRATWKQYEAVLVPEGVLHLCPVLCPVCPDPAENPKTVPSPLRGLSEDSTMLFPKHSLTITRATTVNKLLSSHSLMHNAIVIKNSSPTPHITASLITGSSIGMFHLGTSHATSNTASTATSTISTSSSSINSGSFILVAPDEMQAMQWTGFLKNVALLPWLPNTVGSPAQLNTDSELISGKSEEVHQTVGESLDAKVHGIGGVDSGSGAYHVSVDTSQTNDFVIEDVDIDFEALLDSIQGVSGGSTSVGGLNSGEFMSASSISDFEFENAIFNSK